MSHIIKNKLGGVLIISDLDLRLDAGEITTVDKISSQCARCIKRGDVDEIVSKATKEPEIIEEPETAENSEIAEESEKATDEKPYSELNATEAKKWVKECSDISVLTELLITEERSSVLKVINERISELNK